MILYCRGCGHVWCYQGNAEYETSCPNCKSWIHLENQRLDQPLHDMGNHCGAEYIGVTEKNNAVYYDRNHDLAISLLWPDFTERMEEKVTDTLLNYVADVSEKSGWKYLRELHEIRDLKADKVIAEARFETLK